ncbi:MAG: MBL fold metallo-hydrolase, partial [Myxococcota bacterium]
GSLDRSLGEQSESFFAQGIHLPRRPLSSESRYSSYLSRQKRFCVDNHVSALDYVASDLACFAEAVLETARSASKAGVPNDLDAGFDVLLRKCTDSGPVNRWLHLGAVQTPPDVQPVEIMHVVGFELDVESDWEVVGLKEAVWDAKDLYSQYRRGAVVLSPPLGSILSTLCQQVHLKSPRSPTSSVLSSYMSKYDCVPKGAWEVAPSVYSIPVRTATLPPATHTNTYLIGSSDAILVDPAPKDLLEVDRLVEVLGRIHAEMRVRLIVATHHHEDHIGGASVLSKRLDAPLAAHMNTAALLRGRIHFDRLLSEGDVLAYSDAQMTSKLRVIETPGHASGHICLFNECSRFAVVGDMVAGKGTILIEPEDGDLRLYLESLRRLQQLDLSVMLPAHGKPLFPPGSVLQRYIEHRLKRERAVLQVLSRYTEPATASELVSEVYCDVPSSVWPIALRSLESHLIKLISDGAAIRVRGGYVSSRPKEHS